MNNISKYRKKAGLKQWELAELISKQLGYVVAQSQISYFESGTYQPSIKIAKAIVKVLNNKGVECAIDDLF